MSALRFIEYFVESHQDPFQTTLLFGMRFLCSLLFASVFDTVGFPSARYLLLRYGERTLFGQFEGWHESGVLRWARWGWEEESKKLTKFPAIV